VQQPHLATIQPDLIGEAAIVEAFTGQPSKEAEAPSAVRRAYALRADTAARALVRLVQDFAYALEDRSATDEEKRTGQRIMTWLLTLARNIEDPVELIPLVSALPTETTILREAAAELTERLVTYFSQQTARSNDPAATSKVAIWVNNPANRLSDLGRREEALAAAKEAVRLRRALVEFRPEPTPRTSPDRSTPSPPRLKLSAGTRKPWTWPKKRSGFAAPWSSSARTPSHPTSPCRSTTSPLL
jgi:hypothetical protein